MLDSLEKAMASGALEVQYDGNKKVVYRSLSDMIRMRDLMRRELGITTGALHVTQHSTSKGTVPSGTRNNEDG